MQKSAAFQVLANPQINKQLWDECIDNCPYGLIYAKSFYLDNMSFGWKALAAENYDWVLPVTFRKKFTISYLYQPPFTQQSGIFAKKDVFVPYQKIIKWLQSHYKFWEVNWNYSTETSAVSPSIQLNAATNFILDLSKNYESLRSNYHSILVKNLKRSQHQQLNYEASQDFDECIDLYKKNYGSRISHVKTEDYNNFRNICSYASQNNMICCRKALDNKGETVALSLLLADKRRLYHIINATTEAGRKMQANHFLLDNIIREFSGRPLLFDFEGSDLSGVKSFYESFGAVNQPYYFLRYNSLPWPVSLSKK